MEKGRRVGEARDFSVLFFIFHREPWSALRDISAVAVDLRATVGCTHAPRPWATTKVEASFGELIPERIKIVFGNYVNSVKPFPNSSPLCNKTL
jgi:hypothetical protein